MLLLWLSRAQERGPRETEVGRSAELAANGGQDEARLCVQDARLGDARSWANSRVDFAEGDLIL
jgi:hypothetical protein